MRLQEVKMFARKDHQEPCQYFRGQAANTPLADYPNTILTCTSVPRHNFAYDLLLAEGMSPRPNKYTNVVPFKGHIRLPAVNYEHTFEQAWLQYGNNYEAGNDSDSLDHASATGQRGANTDKL